ncbi:hypothetical protein [Rhizobium sp. BK176]|uniref:hypothetical protein n=1 Tax=Rhizobium sp. BK176 TaxID=2587071 RepID=UPI002167E1CD|nr:hypothetical protein [Rhizobium sp. BK176]MCS4089294.1 hypothetical protein [Rhizobium sp. BK176]
MQWRQRTIPSIDDILNGNARFGLTVTERLCGIASFVARHHEYPDMLLGEIDAVAHCYSRMNDCLDHFASLAIRAVSRIPNRPLGSVQFNIVETSKGNLRVTWLPDNLADFPYNRGDYAEFRTASPCNELVYLRGYSMFADANPDCHDHLGDRLTAIVRKHLFVTVVQMVSEAENRLKNYAPVSRKWVFEKGTGEFEYVLVSPFEIEERLRIAAEARSEKQAEEAEIRRQNMLSTHSSALDGWQREFGMRPEQIIGLSDLFARNKVPMAGRVEILRQKFGVIPTDDIMRFSGVLKRMRYSLECSGREIEAPGIGDAAARALAIECCGTVRDPRGGGKVEAMAKKWVSSDQPASGSGGCRPFHPGR